MIVSQICYARHHGKTSRDARIARTGRDWATRQLTPSGDTAVKRPFHPLLSVRKARIRASWTHKTLVNRHPLGGSDGSIHRRHSFAIPRRGVSGMSAAAIPAGAETLRSSCLRRDSLTHGLAPLHILPSLCRGCGRETDSSETKGDRDDSTIDDGACAGVSLVSNSPDGGPDPRRSAAGR